MINEFFHKIQNAWINSPIRHEPQANPDMLHARLFSRNMTPTQCIELMQLRAAMSGAMIHQPENDKQIFNCLRKIIPLAATVLVDDESKKILPPALNVDYKFVSLEQADDESLFSATAAITGVDFAIAETASIVLSDHRPQARLATTAVEIHLALIHPNQIIPDLTDLSEKIKQYYHHQPPAGMIIISGPSKTSDIEMNLVVGVHGPSQLHYLILAD
jgi:L-lactate utilization protein LutC